MGAEVPLRRRITRSPIDPARVLLSVGNPSAGGTVLFLGTVRNVNEGRAVAGLEYETYREMAEKKVREIEDEAKKRWSILDIAAVHRYGKLKVGEVAVAVAVSSEHRGEAYEACRFAIDEIKRTVPLWKREIERSGRASWVKGNPISATKR